MGLFTWSSWFFRCVGNTDRMNKGTLRSWDKFLWFHIFWNFSVRNGLMLRHTETQHCENPVGLCYDHQFLQLKLCFWEIMFCPTLCNYTVHEEKALLPVLCRMAISATLHTYDDTTCKCCLVLFLTGYTRDVLKAWWLGNLFWVMQTETTKCVVWLSCCSNFSCRV